MPCTMVCLTPVVIAAWPAIASFVAGAAAALGFAAVSSRQTEQVAEAVNTVEVELEQSSVLSGYTDQNLQFIREGVMLTVRTNERGRLVLTAAGSESKESLHQKALTFADRLQQAYAYDKAMTQLRQSGFNVVEQTVEQDQQIHITLRRW